MRKRILCLIAALLFLLPGCGRTRPGAEETRLTVVATTYPVYLFVSAVTAGVEGVAVERLNTGEASCLHDYTLSVQDMKEIEQADVIALNGAELEEFMEDALAASDAFVIDCSEGMDLLENLEHHHEEGGEEDHDHGHWDPHYWMSPMHADHMVSRLREKLCEIDPEHERTYEENAGQVSAQLDALDKELTDMFAALNGTWKEITGLITFHDGFQYFAWAYGLPLLESIEEEAGSEASAHEIVEITELVREYDIPVIFTEVNGSDATAKAISRETGCEVAQLTMVMDGPDDGLSNYLEGLRSNARTIVNGFAGEEVVR